MPKAIIIYETRKGSTQLIAVAIQEGMTEAGIKAPVKKINEVDAADLAKYDCIVLGAPTYNKDIMQTMKPFLFKLEQIDLKGKIGASFGAYGWSGEAVGMLSETMKHIYGMDVLDPGEKLGGTTSGVGAAQYRNFGKKIAEKIKDRQNKK
jgi:flavorubredoxin